MNNIPLVAEKRDPPEPYSRQVNPDEKQARYNPQYNDSYFTGIPVDEAQKLIDEAASKASYRVASELVPKAADEAASKAISSYIQSSKPDLSGLNIMDRKGVTLSQQEYERIRREASGNSENLGNSISLGRRFEDALNQKLNDEVIGSLVGNMFRGGSPTSGDSRNSSTGVVGSVLHELKGVLDTKFGYGLGEKIGGSATELIKTIGQERVGQLIDNYNQGMNPNQLPPQQAQLTPEEHQKRAESTIMSLDSTSITDMTKFMEATGIRNLTEAQKILLAEQDKILQNRGLSRNSSSQQSNEVSQNSQSNESSKSRNKNKSNDMNRDLIDRYDNPNSSFPTSSPFQSDNFTPPGIDFFGSGGEGGNQQNSSFSQSPEEIILSLNPDDPTSLHQYSTMRNLGNLDAITIKKTLMKEQRNLLDKSSKSTFDTNQSSITQPSIQDAQIVQEHGISPDEDQARLRGNSSTDTPSIQQKNVNVENKPSTTDINASPSIPNSSVPSNSDPSNSVPSNSDPMDTIMRILNKLENKIDYLESEIGTLKHENETKEDSSINAQPFMEPVIITKNVDVETLIKKSPRISTFNKISKESETIGNENTENVNEPEIREEVNKETETRITDSEDSINEPEIRKGADREIEIKNLDWFGERNKIMKDIKNEGKKVDEVKSGGAMTKDHKKFTIKKRHEEQKMTKENKDEVL